MVIQKNEKMKAIKYMLMLASAPALWACSADMGSEPGKDPEPAVTLYSYAPAGSEYNPDNDVTVRFVTNNKTSSVKYLILAGEDADEVMKNGGREALRAKVVSEGTEVEDLGSNSYADITLTDIHGPITVAAVAGGRTLGNLVAFTGLDWTSVKEGVFEYGDTGADLVGEEGVEATLEVCDTDENLYRIKNAFGEGTALKMYMLDLEGKDVFGTYRFFRVQPTATPWTLSSYGTISVRDIGYMTGDASYVTSDTGYQNMLYDDYNVVFMLQWYVAAGNLGFDYSYFTPND